MSPTFSIIIPTYRRIDRLRELLERLEPGRQGIPAESYEVIVSDDDPMQSATALLSRQFPAVRFVAGPRSGPAANRNRGAHDATGEWLVFTDDDCRPIDGWLGELARSAASGSFDVIEGKIVVPEKRDTIFRRDVENLHGGVFWSANLAVRRAAFFRLGGFDEDFGQAGGEDMELGHRIRANGLRTTFCGDAIIDHPSHVMTWREVLEFAFRLRWHTLYVMKTNATMSIDASPWKTVPRLVGSRTVDLLRTTWHAARSREPERKWSTVCRTALNWVMFPVVLPYLVYWDLRFRRMLRKRQTI